MYQDPYSAQQPYQPQPGAASYPQQPYQPGATSYPQQPYSAGAASYPQQPYPAGAASYPQQPYQPGAMPYPPSGAAPYAQQQIKVSQGNPRANRAMINGIISILLGLLTLVTLVGYAGIITGSFAVIYGFIGLSRAKSLPNNLGRGQAIAGIVLGFIGLFLVVASLFIRSAVNG